MTLSIDCYCFECLEYIEKEIREAKHFHATDFELESYWYSDLVLMSVPVYFHTKETFNIWVCGGVVFVVAAVTSIILIDVTAVGDAILSVVWVVVVGFC